MEELSRLETLLKAMVNGEKVDLVPQSRAEVYLKQLCEQGVGSGSGLTQAQINALNDMFNVVAYIKEDVSSEYNAFKIAFGLTESGGEEPITPTVTLSSITATYNGGNVLVGTDIDDLTNITVMGTYSDGSTKNIIDYTLSGTINEGSNTITVSYDGKTTIFKVVGYVEEETVNSVLDLTTATVTGESGTYNSINNLEVLSSSLLKFGTTASGRNAVGYVHDLGLEAGKTYTLVGWCEDYNNCNLLTTGEEQYINGGYIRMKNSSSTIANMNPYIGIKKFATFEYADGANIEFALGSGGYIDDTSTVTYGIYILEGEVTSI